MFDSHTLKSWFKLSLIQAQFYNLIQAQSNSSLIWFKLSLIQAQF